MQRVTGIDGLLPAKLINSGRTQARLLLIDDVSCNDRHGHCGCMPTACGDTAEVGLGRFRVREVERLRIVLSGELEHFLAGDLVASKVGRRADLKVFEIDHATGA